MDNPNLEQRVQRLESLLTFQSNAFEINKKRREKAKKLSKIVIILIEKMIQILLPYAIPFIIHFGDNIFNLL
jgi:uncharacterized coiled-coil protein SlyX